MIMHYAHFVSITPKMDAHGSLGDYQNRRGVQSLILQPINVSLHVPHTGSSGRARVSPRLLPDQRTSVPDVCLPVRLLRRAQLHRQRLCSVQQPPPEGRVSISAHRRLASSRILCSPFVFPLSICVRPLLSSGTCRKTVFNIETQPGDLALIQLKGQL